MNGLLSLLVLTGSLLAVMGVLTWLASRIRRRGMARDAFQVITGAHDTMYRPTAEESHYEVQAQAERKTPLSSSDTPWRPSGARGPRTPRDSTRSPRRPSWRALRRRGR
ncbi:hypothetical protein [Streptomyces sp. B6B3]|uniref:hypothetical protein n=1 Tax=Streptomyces sp. B6B3 TaxID=3153570 RepID=UPI00325C79AE